MGYSLSSPRREPNDRVRLIRLRRRWVWVGYRTAFSIEHELKSLRLADAAQSNIAPDLHGEAERVEDEPDT